MPTFEELMEQFRTPPEGGLPETFADELATAYQDDLSIRDAAVKQREADLLEKDKEILAAREEVMRVKAVNYDLLVAAPKAGEPDDDKPLGDNDEPRGVDSLFE